MLRNIYCYLAIFAPVISRKIVGQNIRAYRKARNVSQEMLAFKTKLHENYISLVERGQANISVDALDKISKVLKIPTYSLLIQNSIQTEVTVKLK